MAVGHLVFLWGCAVPVPDLVINPSGHGIWLKASVAKGSFVFVRLTRVPDPAFSVVGPMAVGHLGFLWGCAVPVPDLVINPSGHVIRLKALVAKGSFVLVPLGSLTRPLVWWYH